MNGKLLGLVLSIFAMGALAQAPAELDAAPGAAVVSKDKPMEGILQRASSRRIDLRTLPRTRPAPNERVELEPPEIEPVMAPGNVPPQPAQPSVPPVNAPAPPPIAVFEGLDRFNFGAGSPPDTNGDVGPTHYIQTVNTSIGIFRKTDGFMEAGFSFNTFMSQGNFGNLCDTNNFGDPVVLYDTFEDRWIVTDFAFLTDVSGNVVAPAFQCIAASMSGDPLTGGWNYYSRQITDNLNDYPKFGIWPDGLYMSANMFSFGAGAAFKGARVWAFNKAQMYAGAPTAQVVSFDVGGGDFAVMPSNARLQTGTPPPGRPNLFISTELFLNAVTVYKFHVDWNSISLSTFTGPDVPLAATSWPNAAVANAAQPGTATLLDVLQIRAMVQNQYTNFGGAESLWVPHTVRRANTTGFAAPRWYQVDVSGGTVAAALPQATTWDPDGANVINRFMPSLALDHAGNLAMGYSTSNGTAFPSIAYAGRLASDPINTFGKTEQTFFTGTASQTGTTRWGDYSAMTLDPDGCTFWYTNEYANPADQTFNHRWLTKFGSFTYSECTPVGAGGTVSGTVTTNPGGAPITGATVHLGARSTLTDGSGNYSFSSIPAGTYPSMSANKAGFGTASAVSVVVTDGGTTTQNFSLAGAAANACLTDTTQSDFLAGLPTNVDLNTSPGDVTLTNAPASDQVNTAGTSTGTGFGTPNWTGQTFIAGVTGTLVKADIQLFCNGCGATPPDLTLSVRGTSGGLPTGADLASTTVPGSAFASGASVLFTASFGTPATLTAGTQYVLVLHPVSPPAGSGYFWIRSSPSTYANGSRVLSADSGGTWSADTTRDFNFRTYMQTGFAAAGDLISSTKDANPAQDFTPTWTTLSWTNSAPANTALSFQVAASNSAFGPFAFVGPDNTSGTFFTTSGASLSQFNGKRYLQYRAFLSTSNSAATPTLNDVTTCFVDNAPADLSITKDDGTATAAAGGNVTYTITASNAGPGAANNASVTDTFPSGETCNWTCAGAGGGTCTAAGSGNIADSVNLPAGGTATYSATCAISLTATGSLSNTASIAAPAFVVDNAIANNSATDTDGVVQSSDLAITKTDGVTTATPGGSVTYTITASNAGPSNAPLSTVADTFPAALTCTWTCVGAGGGTCTASGSGNINDTTNLPVGGSVTYTSSCTIAASASGTLSNTATASVQAGASDPNPGNNSATDSDTLAPQADLSITNTDGVTTATPGGSVTYTITAANSGPSNATGATVADAFPASLTCNWTCVGAGGGTCTASGSGNIGDTVNLPSGGSVTYTASCAIASAATGTLSDTATVATPAGVADPTPGNNSATDSDTLVAQADVAVTTYTDNRHYVQVGDTLDYIIFVNNAAGPSSASVNINDPLPVLLGGGSWHCVATPGVTCTNGTSNTLNDTVVLPVGGFVAYVYSASVLSAGPTDQVTNSVTATLTSGVDSVPANNSASDTDVIVIFRDDFEGTPKNLTRLNPSGNVFASADLRVDASLLNTLGIVPVEIGSGVSASGNVLFTLELARFGNDVVMRAVMKDSTAATARTPWLVTDMSPRLISFDWQAAGSGSAGYLTINGGGAALSVSPHREQDRVAGILVNVQNDVPWLVVITH